MNDKLKVLSHILTKEGTTFYSDWGPHQINVAMMRGGMIPAIRPGEADKANPRRFWLAPSYIVYVLEITDDQPAS